MSHTSPFSSDSSPTSSSGTNAAGGLSVTEQTIHDAMHACRMSRDMIGVLNKALANLTETLQRQRTRTPKSGPPTPTPEDVCGSTCAQPSPTQPARALMPAFFHQPDTRNSIIAHMIWDTVMALFQSQPGRTIVTVSDIVDARKQWSHIDMASFDADVIEHTIDTADACRVPPEHTLCGVDFFNIKPVYWADRKSWAFMRP